MPSVPSVKNAGIIENAHAVPNSYDPAIGVRGEARRIYWRWYFYRNSSVRQLEGRVRILHLETVDLNGLLVQFETIFTGQELLYILALIALKLDHLSHLGINHDGAIASEFLLDDLQDLLLIEFLGKTLDSCQSLATISLLNADMDVVLRLLGLSCIFIGFCEGVKGLEVLDCGHKLEWFRVSLGWVCR